MFPLANGETVIRRRARKVQDPYSKQETKRDWTDPDEAPLDGVAIAPSSSQETTTDDRTTTTTRMSLYGPPGMDVLAKDRIVARSGLWEVDGEVADYRNALTGWNPGVEFAIRKVVG